MNVVMEDKIYNILDDHSVNIKPTVIYKGEDVSAECLFYIDDVEYKSNDIYIDISFNYNKIIFFHHAPPSFFFMITLYYKFVLYKR